MFTLALSTDLNGEIGERFLKQRVISPHPALSMKRRNTNISLTLVNKVTTPASCNRLRGNFNKSPIWRMGVRLAFDVGNITLTEIF